MIFKQEPVAEANCRLEGYHWAIYTTLPECQRRHAQNGLKAITYPSALARAIVSDTDSCGLAKQRNCAFVIRFFSTDFISVSTRPGESFGDF